MKTSTTSAPSNCGPRSFVHAAIQSFRPDGDNSRAFFFSGCVRAGLAALFFSGALLAFFSISTAKMLILAAVFGIGFYCLRNRVLFLYGWLDAIARHPVLSACVIAGIGLILRGLFYYVHLGTMLLENQTHDSLIFLNEAREMASGSFPEIKSWVTTGCYALAIKLFGESILLLCLLHVLLQILCVIMLYYLGSRLFHPLAALFAVAAFFWSPHFIAFAFKLYAEHFFYPLILVQFLLLYRWAKNSSVFYAAAMGAIILITLWTKTDAGVFIAVIMLFVFVANTLLGITSVRNVILSLCAAALVVFIGLCGSYSVNLKYHGTRTCLCSDDGYWPRYFGANYATKGRSIMEDKLAIYEAYQQETGETLVFRHNHCPPVLVPYIKAEINRRWSSMTFKEKIRLVYEKESSSWQMYYNPAYRTKLVPAMHQALKVLVGFTAGLALLLLSRRALLDPKVDSVDIIRILPVLYLIGTFLCLVIVEANFRYTACANMFLPLYSGCFVCWMKNKYWKRT